MCVCIYVCTYICMFICLYLALSRKSYFFPKKMSKHKSKKSATINANQQLCIVKIIKQQQKQLQTTAVTASHIIALVV